MPSPDLPTELMRNRIAHHGVIVGAETVWRVSPRLWDFSRSVPKEARGSKRAEEWAKSIRASPIPVTSLPSTQQLLCIYLRDLDKSAKRLAYLDAFTHDGKEVSSCMSTDEVSDDILVTIDGGTLPPMLLPPADGQTGRRAVSSAGEIEGLKFVVTLLKPEQVEEALPMSPSDLLVIATAMNSIGEQRRKISLTNAIGLATSVRDTVTSTMLTEAGTLEGRVSTRVFKPSRAGKLVSSLCFEKPAEQTAKILEEVSILMEREFRKESGRKSQARNVALEIAKTLKSAVEGFGEELEQADDPEASDSESEDVGPVGLSLADGARQKVVEQMKLVLPSWTDRKIGQLVGVGDVLSGKPVLTRILHAFSERFEEDVGVLFAGLSARDVNFPSGASGDLAACMALIRGLQSVAGAGNSDSGVVQNKVQGSSKVGGRELMGTILGPLRKIIPRISGTPADAARILAINESQAESAQRAIRRASRPKRVRDLGAAMASAVPAARVPSSTAGNGVKRSRLNRNQPSSKSAPSRSPVTRAAKKVEDETMIEAAGRVPAEDTESDSEDCSRDKKRGHHDHEGPKEDGDYASSESESNGDGNLFLQGTRNHRILQELASTSVGTSLGEGHFPNNIFFRESSRTLQMASGFHKTGQGVRSRVREGKTTFPLFPLHTQKQIELSLPAIQTFLNKQSDPGRSTSQVEAEWRTQFEFEDPQRLTISPSGSDSISTVMREVDRIQAPSTEFLPGIRTVYLNAMSVHSDWSFTFLSLKPSQEVLQRACVAACSACGPFGKYFEDSVNCSGPKGVEISFPLPQEVRQEIERSVEREMKLLADIESMLLAGETRRSIEPIQWDANGGGYLTHVEMKQTSGQVSVYGSVDHFEPTGPGVWTSTVALFDVIACSVDNETELTSISFQSCEFADPFLLTTKPPRLFVDSFLTCLMNLGRLRAGNPPACLLGTKFHFEIRLKEKSNPEVCQSLPFLNSETSRKEVHRFGKALSKRQLNGDGNNSTHEYLHISFRPWRKSSSGEVTGGNNTHSSIEMLRSTNQNCRASECYKALLSRGYTSLSKTVLVTPDAESPPAAKLSTASEASDNLPEIDCCLHSRFILPQ